MKCILFFILSPSVLFGDGNIKKPRIYYTLTHVTVKKNMKKKEDSDVTKSAYVTDMQTVMVMSR